jgi:hypothetical protein
MAGFCCDTRFTEPRREACDGHGAARRNRRPEVLQDDVIEPEGQHQGV